MAKASKSWAGGRVRIDKQGRPIYVIQRQVEGKRYVYSTRAHTEEAALVHLKRFEMDPEAYRPRRRPKETVGVLFKRDLRREGKAICCEVCGWKLSPPLAGDPVNAHHVVPTSEGGADSSSNLVLLCPNHHAMAHALHTFRKKHGAGHKSRAELIKTLKALRSDPDLLARDLEQTEVSEVA